MSEIIITFILVAIPCLYLALVFGYAIRELVQLERVKYLKEEEEK